MIKKLTINNFQSHLDSILEFSNGINVITGQSNNGKTSILRALNWVISNRPLGITFKSSFSDKKDSCKVTLEINNQKIVREKNTNINQYQLNDTIFDTIGNDVPTEVMSAINMSELNIGGQFEKHFLITDSPGEIGRTINKVVKLDNIDELISNITTKINSTNKELEIKKKDLDKLYLDLEKFKDFDTIEKVVNNIIETDTKIQNNANIINSLNHIIKSIGEADKVINRIETEYGGIEDTINSLEQDWLKYNINVKIAKDLEILIDSINKEEEIIIRTEKIIKDEEFVLVFEQTVVNYIATKDVHFRLLNIYKEWDNHTKLIKKIEKDVESSELEFNNILKDHACPLCGRRN